MTFHVHICNVGQFSGPIYKVFESSIPINRMYLLNSRITGGDFDYCSIEKELIDHMVGINFKDIRTVVIDPFDYHDVYNAVIKIAGEETKSNNNVKFHINFTLGTNIMAGAVCSAAYSIRADLYYIKAAKYDSDNQDELIRISIANYQEVNELKRQKRTAEILLNIAGGTCHNRELISKLSLKPNALSHHTGILREMGLIENKGSSRNIEWVITEKGNEIVKRLQEDM